MNFMAFNLYDKKKNEEKQTKTREVVGRKFIKHDKMLWSKPLQELQAEDERERKRGREGERERIREWK